MSGSLMNGSPFKGSGMVFVLAVSCHWPLTAPRARHQLGQDALKGLLDSSVIVGSLFGFINHGLCTPSTPSVKKGMPGGNIMVTGQSVHGFYSVRAYGINKRWSAR